MPLSPEDQALLTESTQVDPNNIQAEYIRLSGDMAYWSGRYAQTYEAFLTADEAADACKAQLTVAERAAPCLLPGEKKPSIEDAKAAVAAHPTYRALKAAAIRAESEKVQFQGIVEAIRAKKDMLISLGATLRQEREDDPVLRGRR